MANGRGLPSVAFPVASFGLGTGLGYFGATLAAIRKQTNKKDNQ